MERTKHISRSDSIQGEWKMSEVYADIMTGLQEAIGDVRGTKIKKLKRTTITVEPLKEYLPEDIKRIRKGTGFSQAGLAGYMGISVKTVEAWEAGTNQPSGVARRMLQLMETDPDFTKKYPFLKRV